MCRVCIIILPLAIGQVALEQYDWPACLGRIALGLDFFSCMFYSSFAPPLSLAHGVFVLHIMDIYACLLGPRFMYMVAAVSQLSFSIRTFIRPSVTS